MTDGESYEETAHRGVRWRRESDGTPAFYDADGGVWVRWAPASGAPPLPPRWQILGVATRVTRPRRRSPWRVVPLVVVVAAVIYAAVQSVVPSGSQAAKEAKASAALVGQCLRQDGTLDGHPRYHATPVPCSSGRAAGKVVQVVRYDGTCPYGSTGFEFPYLGVAHPHVECVAPLAPTG